MVVYWFDVQKLLMLKKTHTSFAAFYTIVLVTLLFRIITVGCLLVHTYPGVWSLRLKFFTFCFFCYPLVVLIMDMDQFERLCNFESRRSEVLVG